MSTDLYAPTEHEERERLQRRKEIREKLARKSTLLAKATLIKQQLDQLDHRADEAANRHAESARPLQKRLAEVERKIESALAERKPVPSGVEDERTQLLSELFALNDELQSQIVLVDRLRGPLLKEHRDLQVAAAECGDESRLTQPGIADWRKRCELFAAQRRQAAADGRVASARNELERLEPALQRAVERREPSQSAHYRRRVNEWRAEQQAASQEQQAAAEVIQEIVGALRQE